jgi:hypothetical protein
MAQAEYIYAALKQDGEKALGSFIDQRETEALSLDFKRASTTAASTHLEQSDRDNLAKAISGFGNTAGGVIVWGIDCRPDRQRGDVAHSRQPVPNVRRFISLLESAVGGATLPSHSGVEHHLIAEQEGGAGFVASLIPQADNYPLQVPGMFRYFMRAGSSFEPIPHSILSTMFGRRPTPQLRIDATVNQPATLREDVVSGGVQLTITNVGASIAQDVFIAIEYPSIPGNEMGLKFSWMSDPRREQPFNGPRSLSVIFRPNVRLPPGGQVITYSVALLLSKEIHAPLDLRVTAGSGNGPPTHLLLSQTENRLRHSHRLGEALQVNKSIDTSWLAMRLFGLVTD